MTFPIFVGLGRLKSRKVTWLVLRACLRGWARPPIEVATTRPMWPGSPSSMAGRRGHGRKYPPSKAPSTPSPGRCAPSSPTASHRANWRVPKIILSGPPCQGPPFSMPGRGYHAWNYPPSNAPLAPSPGRCPPSRGPPPPSSTHPIRPPLPGGPPLDAGAEGARLEVPPIEGPVGPVAGKVCPFEPPPGPLRVRRPSRRANWRVPKILLSGPPARAPPPLWMPGRRGHA